DGSKTTSDKRRDRGDQLANFKQGYGDYSGVAGWSSDGADVTNEIKSYPPNDFGLYDMAGNVAEWVADVYRPKIDMELNDFNYYRGNVYTQTAIDENGNVKIIDGESVKIDTLSNGKLAVTGLPGEVERELIEDDETYMRTNYDRSDNRDYWSGDKQSSRYYTGDDDEEFLESHLMYNSPLDNVVSVVDSAGIRSIEKEYDTKNRTTLISNESHEDKVVSW